MRKIIVSALVWLAHALASVLRIARFALVTIIGISAVCAGGRAGAATYVQTDLVSDVTGLATLTDPELKNSWGISFRDGSHFWISDQGSNAATLYAVTGSTTVSKVNINPPSGFVAIPQGPTGTVGLNANSSFAVSINSGGNGMAANFLFANLNGTISAWNTGTTAFVQATTAGASYTGLAINHDQTRLYAANGVGTGSINVFDNTFAPVNLGANAFIDPNLPTGLVPFNVQDINGKVYVTYAPAGRTAQTTAALGQGVVSVYDENGAFQQRLVTGGNLAAPWGIALAPSSFGQFGGDLLVGNFSFSHSFISAFDPTTGVLEGMIPIDVGGNDPGGLWALMFGSGGSNGSPNTLYFTDGINSEADGLFGAIAPTPIPATLPLFATGLGGLGLLGWRRKRKAQAVLSF
jgi:uncharacterized protein (TIGR03118 family)